MRLMAYAWEYLSETAGRITIAGMTLVILSLFIVMWIGSRTDA